MIVYYQEEGRRVKREEIRRSSRSIRGGEKEREISRIGNPSLEEADCLELRKIPAFALSIHGDSSLPLFHSSTSSFVFLRLSLEAWPLFSFSYSLFPYERKGSRFSTEGDNKSGNKLFNTFHFGLVVR